MAVKQASAKLGAVGFATTATFANPLPASISAGSTLLFYSAYRSSAGLGLSSVTIGGQAATLDERAGYYYGSFIDVWRVENHPGGNTGEVIVTGPASTYSVPGQLLELDAFDALPLDRSATAIGPASPITITSAATSQADEFVLALVQVRGGGANSGLGTVTSGYTAGYTEQDEVNSKAGQAAYKYVTAIGTQSATFTHAGTETEQLLVTYKATPPSGGVSYILPADSASLALTGQAATLKLGRVLTAAATSFTITGQAATLARGRTLAAAGTSFTLAGQVAGLRVARQLIADSGTYAATGAAATLVAGRRLDAASGAYAWAGQDAGLIYAPIAAGYVLAADGGSYTVTGGAVSLRYARRLSAESTGYVWGGTAASLNVGRRLAADAGALTLAGSNAALVYAPSTTTTLTAESGALALAGSAVALRVTRRLVAGSGVLTLVGGDAGLRAGTAVPNRTAWRRATGSQSRPVVPNNERLTVGSKSRPAPPTGSCNGTSKFRRTR